MQERSARRTPRRALQGRSARRFPALAGRNEGVEDAWRQWPSLALLIPLRDAPIAAGKNGLTNRLEDGSRVVYNYLMPGNNLPAGEQTPAIGEGTDS